MARAPSRSDSTPISPSPSLRASGPPGARNAARASSCNTPLPTRRVGFAVQCIRARIQAAAKAPTGRRNEATLKDVVEDLNAIGKVDLAVVVGKGRRRRAKRQVGEPVDRVDGVDQRDQPIDICICGRLRVSP